jgi:hypothetical protein
VSRPIKAILSRVTPGVIKPTEILNRIISLKPSSTEKEPGSEEEPVNKYNK